MNRWFRPKRRITPWPLRENDGLDMLKCNGAVWIASQKIDPRPNFVTVTELERLLHV